MREVDYRSSAYPVRADLIEAQRLAWRRLGAPSAFLDGARRVEIAREARNAPFCALCRRRKEALSPFAVEGSHDSLGVLGNAEVDAIHRIVTDPGRLSREWLDGLFAAGLDDRDYIESLGVICVVMVVDTFRRALDLPPFALPEPSPGAPSGYSAPGAREHDGWVRLVAPEDVVPDDGALYGETPIAPVVKALSLVPDAKRHYWDLAEAHYLPGEEMRNFATGIRAIDRMQMELVASRVSALHQCVY